MDVLVGGRPDYRDRAHFPRVDGQQAAVSQQHGSALLRAVGDDGVGGAVVLCGFVGPGGVIEEAKGEQLSEDLVHARFEGRLRDGPVGQRGFDLGRVVAARANVEVQARVEVVFGLVTGQEVRHDESVRAPQSPECVFEQERIRARVDPFQQVVRAHHRRAVALLDRRFEGGQLDLVQGARVDVDVDEGTAAIDAEHGRDAVLALLVVGGEVLDVCHHPLRLQAFDPPHRGLAREERVLAVGLERAPAKRRAHDVHRRPPVAVEAAVLYLLPHYCAIAARGRRVEVRGERHGGRHRRRRGELDRRHPHVARFLARQHPDLV